MRAASGTANAKTPIGASASTQRTSTSIASASPSKNVTIGRRRSIARRSRATPNNSEKTINGSIAPSAAARMGFAGTRSVTHCPNVGKRFAPSCATPASSLALARIAAVEAGSIMRARIG